MTCSLFDPTGCATSIAKSVAGDAFGAIATDFAKAADSVTNWMWGQMSSATAVHLGGQGFDLDLAIVATIALTVAVGLFLVQIITSVLRRDGHGLARAGKGLFVAFLGGGVAVAVTNLLLQAIDALSTGVVHAAMGTTLSGMGGKLLAANAILTMQNPSVMLLAAIATIAAVMIVWFALMVRKVLIVVSAVFAPLAFAGSLADISVAWTRKWIEIMAALIASKLILVIIFIVGWGVLLAHVGQSGGGVGQGVTQVVSGILILGVAGLAPWMALKLVHFSGDHVHQLHAMSGAATGGAAVAVNAPRKAASIGSSAARLAGVGAIGGAAGAAAGAGRGGTGGSGAGAGGGTGGMGGAPPPTQASGVAAGGPVANGAPDHAATGATMTAAGGWAYAAGPTSAGPGGTPAPPASAPAGPPLTPAPEPPASPPHPPGSGSFARPAAEPTLR